jgi:hypothetical protein
MHNIFFADTLWSGAFGQSPTIQSSLGNDRIRPLWQIMPGNVIETAQLYLFQVCYLNNLIKFSMQHLLAPSPTQLQKLQRANLAGERIRL